MSSTPSSKAVCSRPVRDRAFSISMDKAPCSCSNASVYAAVTAVFSGERVVGFRRTKYEPAMRSISETGPNRARAVRRECQLFFIL